MRRTKNKAIFCSFTLLSLVSLIGHLVHDLKWSGELFAYWELQDLQFVPSSWQNVSNLDTTSRILYGRKATSSNAEVLGEFYAPKKESKEDTLRSSSNSDNRRWLNTTLVLSTNKNPQVTFIPDTLPHKDGFLERNVAMVDLNKDVLQHGETSLMPFPRWRSTTDSDDDLAQHGIRIERLVDFMQSVRRRKSTLFPGGQSKDFPEIPYVVDSTSVWSSSRIRSRTKTLFLRVRGLYMEDLMISAHRYILKEPESEVTSRWPKVVQSVKHGEGFPFLAWYGDFQGCNYKNWNRTVSIPIFTVCGKLNCNHSFPMPTYKTIKDSTSSPDEWEVLFASASSRYPWKNKIPKVVWRGGLTGDLKNYTSSRARIARFSFENRNETTLDIGISSIPGRHESPESILETLGGSLLDPISPMEDFQKYIGILDIDGNSWSSRFGTLLCYNSVTLKVDPDHVDYFFLKYLKPWRHFVPVKSDLSDLLEKARYVTDPANDKSVREIVANANEWCKTHMTKSSLTEDMLDIWETYVGHLDAADNEWTRKWTSAKKDIFKRLPKKDSFLMKRLVPMRIAMKG